MKFRSTAILALLVAALGAWLWWVERPKVEREGVKKTLLAPFDRNRIAGIELVYPDASITLRRKDGRWRIESPVDVPGDAGTVRNLLDGKDAQYEHNGEAHTIRFMLSDKGYRNLKDRIPLYLAGYGPKAQALAGEIADGLTSNIPRGGSLDQILANVNKGLARSGRSLNNFHLSVRVNFAVLEPGEPVDSGRIVNEFGPAITTSIHSTVDRHLEFGEDPPEFLRPIWKDYVAFHMARPAAERQKMMHESHNVYVAPDERRFVTPEVIKRFCIVGQPVEVLEQVRELERQGVRQLMCNFPLARGYQMVRDYAKNIIQKL